MISTLIISLCVVITHLQCVQAQEDTKPDISNSNAVAWDVIAVASDFIAGQDASFHCKTSDVTKIDNFVSAPVFESVSIIAEDGVNYVTYNLNSGQRTSKDDRYSYDPSNDTLFIKNVSCKDEKRLRCVVTTNLGGVSSKKFSEFYDVKVKVPPGDLVPMTLNVSQMSNGLSEGFSLKASCTANVGRRGKGRIQWRIYRDKKETIVDKRDPRITTSQEELSCSVISESTLSLHILKSTKQKMVLVCSVLNDDFPLRSSNCLSGENRLCQRSPTINFPVMYCPDSVEVGEPLSMVSMVFSGNPDLIFQMSWIRKTPGGMENWVNCLGMECENLHQEQNIEMSVEPIEEGGGWSSIIFFESATQEMTGTWIAQWRIFESVFDYSCTVSVLPGDGVIPPLPVLVKTTLTSNSANLTFEVAQDLQVLSQLLKDTIHSFLLEVFSKDGNTYVTDIEKEATFENPENGKVMIRYIVSGLKPSTVYLFKLTVVGYSENRTLEHQFQTHETNAPDIMEAPFIFSRLPNIVKFGDNVSLKCITYEEDVKFKWFHRGNEIPEENSARIERNANEITSGDYSCRITRPTQMETSDLYSLIVVNENSFYTASSTAQFTLQMTYTPELKDAQSTQYYVMRSYVIELVQSVMTKRDNFLDGDVFGFRNGSVIVDVMLAERLLTTTDPRESDLSSYFKEQMNADVINNFTLMSLRGDGIISKYDNPDMMIFEGRRLDIVCMFSLAHTIEPDFEIVWKFNQSIIDQARSSTFTFSDTKQPYIWRELNGLRATLYNFTLSIKDFQIRLTGEYMCEMKIKKTENPFRPDGVRAALETRLYYSQVQMKPTVKISPLSAVVKQDKRTSQINVTCSFTNSAAVFVEDAEKRVKLMNEKQVNIFSKVQTIKFSPTIDGDVDSIRCVAVSAFKVKSVSEVCKITRIKDTSITCKKNTDERGNVWGEAPAGTTSTEYLCPQGYSGSVTRACLQNGIWDKSNYIGCSKEVLVAIEEEITNINKDGVTPSQKQITDLSESVNNSISGPEVIYSGDIVKVVDILDKVSKVAEDDDDDKTVDVLVDSKALENFASTTDTILSTDASTWNEITQDTVADKKSSDVGSKLVVAMEKLAVSSLNEATYSSEPIVKKNVAIKRDKISQDNIMFPSNSEIAYKKYGEWVVKSKNKLFLSANNFDDDKQQGINFHGAFKDRLQYAIVLFNDVDSKFVVNPETQDRSPDGQMLKNTEVSSDIMSFSLSKSITKLSSPLKLEFEMTQENRSNPVCAYLETSLGPSPMWSSKGCRTVEGQGGIVKCECNHLTNFAILMSPYKAGKDDKHHDILSIVTYVGCGISIICLIITLVMHAVTWKYVRENRAILHVNLSVVLILAYACFLGGIDRTENDVVCTVFAAVLHFLFLTVFSIMLVEGIQIFISVTFVFKTDLPLGVMLSLVYFFPLLIVGITYGLTESDDYRDEDFCWLNIDTGSLWGFVGPALTVILVNFIIMCVTLRAMLSTVTMKAKPAMAKAKSSMRAICVLSPIFGITWVFGVFSLNDSLVVFQYLFAIFNTLQGFLVFLFYCAFCNQIKDGLRHMLRKHRSRSMATDEHMFSNSSGKSSNRHRYSDSSKAGYSSESGSFPDPNMRRSSSQRTGSTQLGSRSSSQSSLNIDQQHAVINRGFNMIEKM